MHKYFSLILIFDTEGYAVFCEIILVALKLQLKLLLIQSHSLFIKSKSPLFDFQVFLSQFQATALLPPGAVACDLPLMKRVPFTSFYFMMLRVMVGCQSSKIYQNTYVIIEEYVMQMLLNTLLLPSKVICAASACKLDWIESDLTVTVHIKDMNGVESAKTIKNINVNMVKFHSNTYQCSQNFRFVLLDMPCHVHQVSHL